MKKALITGILGQDGYYLTKHLLELGGYEVYGTVRRNPVNGSPITKLIPPEHLLFADMTNESQLYEAIVKVMPDEIYNLAGQTFPPASWQYAWKVFDVNAGGLARILEIVSVLKPSIRIFQASTADMFGPVEGPCNEQVPMNPGTPYGVSKLAAHKMALLYRKRGLFVSTCILFNHDSPLRGIGFVTRKIVDHIVDHFVAGQNEILSLGYLDGMRDWGFAGDYVQAMHLSLQNTLPDDYVIGTAKPHSVREFLQLALMQADIEETWFFDRWLHSDSSLKRPNETKLMCADYSKAFNRLGWQPTVTFDALIKLMVKEAIAKVTNERKEMPSLQER